MTTGSAPQATCPKCGSLSVQAVPIERKKLGEAALTEYFLGTAAGVAAGSDMVIQAVCLSCGCQWFPGSPAEQQMRALSGQLGEDAKKKAEVAIVRYNAQENSKKNLSILVAVLVAVGGGLWYVNSSRSSNEATVESPAPTSTPQTTSPARPLISPSTGSVAPETLPWVASSRGHTYYLRGCNGANRLSPDNLIYFHTEQEAEQAGYTRSPAEGC